MVTREQVTWAYRLLLGREPESETVINEKLALESVDNLRQIFLSSSEFRKDKRTHEIAATAIVRISSPYTDVIFDGQVRLIESPPFALPRFPANIELKLACFGPTPVGADGAVEIYLLNKTGYVLESQKVASVTPRFLEDIENISIRIHSKDEDQGFLRIRWTSDIPRLCIRELRIIAADRDQLVDSMWQPHLRHVVFGNTGMCNASCIHCPTGYDANVRRFKGVADDSHFETFVSQLAHHPIENSFNFGLWGEPFLDKTLSGKVRLVKQYLPNVPIVISTNAGIFDPLVHSDAIRMCDQIMFHMETIEPKEYGRLMSPLKLDKVITNVIQMLHIAGDKIVLASPVHKKNIASIAATVEWWNKLTGSKNEFMPLDFNSRCCMDPQITELHLMPVAMACDTRIVDDLIVDWDFNVYLCCQDFGRTECVGNAVETPLSELVMSSRRKFYFDKMRNGKWNEVTICSKCFIDDHGRLGQRLRQMGINVTRKV